MDTLETILPVKLFETLVKNNLTTPKQILVSSLWDIKHLTELSSEDVKLIKNLVSGHMQTKSMTCDRIISSNTEEKVCTGCIGIDNILNGGFRRGAITEIYGESGTGKTQIAIQTTAFNWATGCVYICTEDLFPIKRYEQIKKYVPNYNSHIDCGKNTFVDHITESNHLLTCIRARLPKLLSQTRISLLVIDTIAAPFRVDHTNYIQRADEIRQLVTLLIDLAQSHNFAILCINQVTAAINSPTDQVLPSLGLAWSNMIHTRLRLRKISNIQISELSLDNKVYTETKNMNMRELFLEFSADLPNSITQFTITTNGLSTV